MPFHYFTPQTPLLNTGAFSQLRRLHITVGQTTLQFATGAGTFSKTALDDGSRLLIETLVLPPNARFCDLGCGWGAIGAFVAATFPDSQVWACDINPRAAQLSQFNFRQNQLQNAVAWAGDGLQAARPDFFDVVACNPPVRAGNAAIQALFEGAFGSLKRGGSLWVVLRTAQGAKSWQKRLETQFGTCETVEIRYGYRILRAQK